MFTASQLLDKINNYISEIQFTREPKGLYEPIEYILSLGGKRIRPVLMLMAYNLYREDVASIYMTLPLPLKYIIITLCYMMI